MRIKLERLIEMGFKQANSQYAEFIVLKKGDMRLLYNTKREEIILEYSSTRSQDEKTEQ